MSLKSFYWKTRTLISGDYREVERNCIAARNERVIKKYKGREDIYCILRLYTDEGGLFNFFLKALAGISYSVQNGFIPVIDMQTKEIIFLNKAERKKRNVWEDFFTQPAGVSFDEVKDKKNTLILENPRLPGSSMMQLMAMEKQTAYWRKLCKKYIHFSPAVEEEIKKYADEYDKKDRWLGVLARGTDYLSKGVGHAVQPDMDTLAQKIQSVKEEYKCDGIFLATEDSQILDELNKAFPGEIMRVEQKRYRGRQDEKLGQKADYRKDAIVMNISYLAAIWYLSRCSCFITADTGGASGAYILSDGYEYTHCWFLGTMGSTDDETLDISRI